LLDLGYHKDKRTVLKLPACIAPYQAAVFPLVARDGLDVKAEQMAEQLKGCIDVLYDAGDSIGRRYARADEIGIPFAITIDGQTLKDGTVTVRARDTTEQVRISGKELSAWIVARL
jgi:glycyl-tRNA synthetase